MVGEGPAHLDRRRPTPEPPPRMASVRPVGPHQERERMRLSSNG
jgi:hypothetical protein